MHLASATDDHVTAMMGWFADRHACRLWGGPVFRYPFTRATFLEDTRHRDIASFVLVDADGIVTGFGQYYARASRCHLSRLAVSPPWRGRGIGRRLVAALARHGAQRLGAKECSLFVEPENAPATRLYQRLGFVEAPYPLDDLDLGSIRYMVAPMERLRSIAGTGAAETRR